MTLHDVSMPHDVSVTDDDRPEGGAPAVRFDEIGLHPDLVACLERRGIVEPFPIQHATIPDAMAGRDVLGRGRTGSGKTLAFGLPMLHQLEGRRARRGRPLGLVLVPTRELAMQVHDALEPFAHSVGLRTKAVFGGVPFHKQIQALRRGVEVLVATPGRLTDLVERRECELAEVSVAVLDEADQMADMGFLPIVSEILDGVPADGQRLLFSATLDRGVDALVEKYLTDPVTHSVDPVGASVSTMSHHLLVVAPQHKVVVTAQIAARRGRTIAFARTKLGVDRIVDQLRDAGVRAAGLHGSKTQAARTRILAEFREGTVPVLVATDVAARGIHVDDVDLVLHVDPAADSKDYLHRAGRTARAGESGTVATLVLPHQRRGVERLLEQAGVRAEERRVRPGDADLMAVTGARPEAVRDSGRSDGNSIDAASADGRSTDARSTARRSATEPASSYEDTSRRPFPRPRTGTDRPRGGTDRRRAPGEWPSSDADSRGQATPRRDGARRPDRADRPSAERSSADRWSADRWSADRRPTRDGDGAPRRQERPSGRDRWQRPGTPADRSDAARWSPADEQRTRRRADDGSSRAGEGSSRAGERRPRSGERYPRGGERYPRGDERPARGDGYRPRSDERPARDHRRTWDPRPDGASPPRERRSGNTRDDGRAADRPERASTPRRGASSPRPTSRRPYGSDPDRRRNWR